MAESKRAVVVGGATGIGSGICRVLAARGYRVDLCDIDEEGAHALTTELSEADIAFHRVDVTDAATIMAAERAIRADGQPCDLLFANAGAITLKPFIDATDDDWSWLFSINFFGCVKTIRSFLPGLLTQQSPSRICVTSSVAALRTPPMLGQTLYMASKSSQIGFCNGLRVELEGTNVGLSVIVPGPVQSKLRDKSEITRPGAVKIDISAGLSTGPAFISPEDAAERIMEGVALGRPYIATHPGDKPLVRAMQDLVLQAFD
jgi:NAD(P)-dependent dehydrogenase (short-subunit alcohol dehydrogenase family)